MELSDGSFCTYKAQVNGKTKITIYEADDFYESGNLVDGAGKDYTSGTYYTKFYVVEETEGEGDEATTVYRWKSENLFAGVDGLKGKELYIYTEPRYDDWHSSRLEDIWHDIDGEDFNYTIYDTQIFKVEDGSNINISNSVAEALVDGTYDITEYMRQIDKLNGSVSIADMASKKLGADVLVNGTNLEEYLSNDGYLNVKGSGKLVGTRFNDRFVGSERNDTITGKAGSNLYAIDTITDFGDDTVVLSKDETMTLEFNSNKYSADDLKFELVNGGKDIKISSDTKVTEPQEYEIRATLTPIWIETSEGELIMDMDYEDEDLGIYVEASSPVEVVFKMKEVDDGEGGTEYKWMSENILKRLAPNADPIYMDLPLDIPSNPDGDEGQDATNSLFRDYPYDSDDGSVSVTVDSIHVYQIINGTAVDISADVLESLKNESYEPESFISAYGDFEGTVTLKDFGQKDLGATVKVGDKDLAKYLSSKGVVEVSGSKKITATRFNDNIAGSTSVDKIYTYDGNDTINAGKGNDKIYLGNGNKTLMFKSGDGNDIIYSATQDTSIDIQLKGVSSWEDSRSGNNLVITCTTTDGKKVDNKKAKKLYVTTDGTLTTTKTGNESVKKELYSHTLENGEKIYSTKKLDDDWKSESGTQFYIDKDGKVTPSSDHQEDLVETITIDGFFKNASDIKITTVDADGNKTPTELIDNGKYIGNDDIEVSYEYGKDSGKAQTLKGTAFNETFNGGRGKDKIYTGKGTDIVTAGKNNDTIYLNGAGEKTVNFTKGDGNDTIYMNYDGVKANLMFEDCGIVTDDSEDTEGRLIFGRKGNDLLITRDYGDEKTEQVTTVKDYFNNTTNSELFINEEEFDPNSVTFEYVSSGKIEINDNYSYEIISEGKKNDKITITGSGNNYIDSGAGNDTVIINSMSNDDENVHNTLNYTSGNDKYMVMGESDDEYNVEFNKKTNLIISDNGGDDVLNIISENTGFTYLFDVDKNGNINTDTSLIICDANNLKRSKKGLTGSMIEIENYFSNDGNIEEINTGEGTLDIDTEAIASEVAGWLKATRYSSAVDVMEKGSTTEFKELLAVFQDASEKAVTYNTGTMI